VNTAASWSEAQIVGVWFLLMVVGIAAVFLVHRLAPGRRPRQFDEVPPVDVRAAYDRRGELWLREDDTGTYWTSRGLRCHVHELLASRGPLVEVDAGRHR